MSCSGLDFDSAGMHGGSGQCGLNPPELAMSHGFVWLTDGSRTVTVNTPFGAGGGISPSSWQIDPRRRLAYVIGPGIYLQILQIDLDTLQQTAPVQTSFQLPSTLYLNQDGSFRVLNSYSLIAP